MGYTDDKRLHARYPVFIAFPDSFAMSRYDPPTTRNEILLHVMPLRVSFPCLALLSISLTILRRSST